MSSEEKEDRVPLLTVDLLLCSVCKSVNCLALDGIVSEQEPSLSQPKLDLNAGGCY